MLLLLIGILTALIVFSTICYYKCRNNEPFAVLTTICSILLAIVVITTIVGTVQVVKLPALEQQQLRGEC
jgi:uncharacterized protein involved in response to NO